MRPRDPWRAGRTVAVALAALLAGCGTTPATVQDVAVVRGERPRILPGESLARFTPVVGASVRGEGRCFGPQEVPGGRGTVFGLLFDGPPARSVSVARDSTGTWIRYGDLRGPVPGITGETGDHTGISIDFRRGRAILSNHPEDGPSEVRFYPLDGILDAPNLDVPRRWIARIVARCT